MGSHLLFVIGFFRKFDQLIECAFLKTSSFHSFDCGSLQLTRILAFLDYLR